MSMTDRQRDAVRGFVTHKSRANEYIRMAAEKEALAEQCAADLIESYSGQTIPEAIVYKGCVVLISRAMLSTEHAMPHHAVRLAEDAVVEVAP